jgi:hypothetical protein
MNKAWEMHDSTVLNFKKVGRTASITFKGMVHTSKGIAGIDAGKVYLQEIRISMSLQATSTDQPIENLEVAGGEIHLNGQKINNLIDLPFADEGAFELSLELINGPQPIKIKGTNIKIETIGHAEYLEEFP